MGWVACAVVVAVFLLLLGSLSRAGSRRLTARFRGRCMRCGATVTPGDAIDWHPETRQVQHADCAPHLAAARSETVRAALSRIERASGPVSRRNALAAALAELPSGQHRTTLLVEASRIEVNAVLDKVDSLKTPSAKRRHLEAALRTLREDELPDELQREQLAWLEDALRALEE